MLFHLNNVTNPVYWSAIYLEMISLSNQSSFFKFTLWSFHVTHLDLGRKLFHTVWYNQAVAKILWLVDEDSSIVYVWVKGVCFEWRAVTKDSHY